MELLLAHALELPRITLYTSFDRPLTRDELQRFRGLYERRLQREPLQYIVESSNFMGLALHVDPRVLIPRPETETLVEQVMLRCNERTEETVAVLEIGTGSGNIVVALAKYVRGIRLTSFDVSPHALEVARANARTHQVDPLIEFHLMDVFEPVDQLLRKRYDIVVSNPPYVARDEWSELQEEIRGHEPESAVTDGKDGLEFYRRLAEIAPLLLNDRGSIFLEVGYGQASTVRQLMEVSGYYDLSVTRDLDGIPRVIAARSRARGRNLAMTN